MNFKYSASQISNKIATNQMNNDLVIPILDVKNYYASMDQNKPMVGNQSYLGMNSMAQAIMVKWNNMDDVLAEVSDDDTEIFSLIAC